MFGFLQVPVVQCLAFQDGVLYLQSPQVLKSGRSLRLQAELPVRQQDGPLTVNLQARVQDILEPSPLWEKRAQNLFGQAQAQLYAVQVESPASALPYLEQLLEGQPQAQELRLKPRVEKRLRATSPILPGFHGIVVDLSETGLGMLISSPLERGRVFDFDIDFEEQGMGRMSLTGKVCWCRPEAGGGHRIGVEFQTLSRRQAWELREMMQVLLRAEASSLRDDRFLRG